MLEVILTLISPGSQLQLGAEIGNVSRLAAVSDYGAWIEGARTVQLNSYPRWSEPVRGLLARCIALADFPGEQTPVPGGWTSCRIDIGLNPGGRAKRPTRLAMCRLVRQEDGVFVGWQEGHLRGWEALDPLPVYGHVWELAFHGLAVSVWNSRQIPPAREVQIQCYEGRYVRSSDLPEPLRSAFEWNRRISSRPNYTYDSHWHHDLVDFLDGSFRF